MHRRFVAMIALVGCVLFSACADEAAAPTTTLERIDYVPLPSLGLGETARTDLWSDCGINLEIGDESYVPDNDLVPFFNGTWEFPTDWDVIVYAEGHIDGPNWVLLNAVATRLDATTVEVAIDGGGPVGIFTLDTTPFEEQLQCG